MPLTSFQLNIDKPQGTGGEPTSALVFQDSGDGVNYLMTVKPAVDPTYPSKPSSISAGSGIVVANVTGKAITGSGTAGQVPLFTGPQTVARDPGFTWQGAGANIEVQVGIFDGAHPAVDVFQGQMSAVRVVIAPATINAPAPTDQQSLIVRRVGAAQTANVVEITDELFAVQLAIDKSGVLFPGVAAGVNLGSAPNPFSGVFIGSAANRSGRLTGTFSGNRTITFPDNTGTVGELNLAQSWSAKQTFGPTAAVAGLNVGSVAGDPAAPINGDLWYDSTGNLLRAQINGASVSLGGAAGTGVLTQTLSDAATNSVSKIVDLIHNTSGAPAAGYGESIRFGLQDSTTANQDAGLIDANWIDATHSTRSSQVAIQAVDQGTALADVVRFRFQHNAGTPVAQIVIVGTAGQQGIPQICGPDLQSGFRFTANNIFAVIGGNENVFQIIGAGLQTVALAVDNVNADVRLSRTGAKAGKFDDGANGAVAMAITGVLNVASVTATPAAGSTAARLLFGTTAGFGIYYGSGAPTVSAAQGSLYLRSDGSTAVTRAYINTDGGTTWTAITTVL